jgi:EAL domain-containing protein (putative c-di-GMP-specific phosphodiesterase class I)
MPALRSVDPQAVDELRAGIEANQLVLYYQPIGRLPGREIVAAKALVRRVGALRMDVVAEGVETETQVVALMRRGCTLMQGYVFGRPQRANRIGGEPA